MSSAVTCLRGSLGLAVLMLSAISCRPPEAAGDVSPQEAQERRPLVGGILDTGDPAVVALVQITSSGGLDFSCTGTLIGPSTIVFAAHCVTTRKEYAYFGNKVPSSTSFPNDAFVEMIQSIPHPQWVRADDTTDDYDIAIARLSHPVTNVTPIRLYEVPPTVGQSIRHVGFGSTSANSSEDQGSGIKREVTYTVRRVEGQIEAGGTGTGHCYGDSGGPGFLKLPGSNEERVGSIVSWGASDCIRQSWDTRVDTNAAWLRSVQAGWEPVCSDNGTCEPGCVPMDVDCSGTVTLDAGTSGTGNPAPSTSGATDAGTAASPDSDPSHPDSSHEPQSQGPSSSPALGGAPDSRQPRIAEGVGCTASVGAWELSAAFALLGIRRVLGRRTRTPKVSRSAFRASCLDSKAAR